jgi:hypothetical protein
MKSFQSSVCSFRPNRDLAAATLKTEN